MSKEVLKKYEGVRVIFNDVLANSMSKGMAESNQFALERYFAMSDKGGDILVCASKEQDIVLELVVGQAAPDSAITLYQPHTALGSPGSLLKAREEVINAILNLRPGGLMLNDPIRKRPAMLSELGFAQLIDTLNMIENPSGVAA